LEHRAFLSSRTRKISPRGIGIRKGEKGREKVEAADWLERPVLVEEEEEEEEEEVEAEEEEEAR
jgi:hypothetical protein